LGISSKAAEIGVQWRARVVSVACAGVCNAHIFVTRNSLTAALVKLLTTPWYLLPWIQVAGSQHTLACP
jgi:hypothetical protein